MVEPVRSATVNVRAFERLRERATTARNWCAHHEWGKEIPANLAALPPEDVILVTAEIDAADEILGSVIEKYNRSTGSNIRYVSYRTYERQNKAERSGFWASHEETSRVVAMWCNMALVQIEGLEDKVVLPSMIHHGDIVRDKYVADQAVAIGPRATVYADQIHQMRNLGIDATALLEDLQVLRAAVKAEAVEPEHDLAVAEIAKAETAAKQGNVEKAIAHLKTAGAWAFDVATKIGVGLAIAAMKPPSAT